MQANSAGNHPHVSLAAEEQAVPGYASDVSHRTLVSGQGNDASRLKDMAGNAMGTARQLARDARSVAKEQADATAAWVGGTVRESPMRTLGIAVAMGAVIGLLLGRR